MILRTAVAAAALGLAASPALSQVPAGGEFQVNVFTTGTQSRPSVAADPRGGFVVAWGSDPPQTVAVDVFARRYDPFGVPIGGEFQVNAYSTGIQTSPAIAVDPEGNFVIVWHGHYQGDIEVLAKIYDAGGVARGPEFRVNTYTTGEQGNAAVAFVPGGGFVVVWQDNAQDGSSAGVFAQRHSPSGERLGAEFRVNTYVDNAQTDPKVAVDGAGRFVVAWTSEGQDGHVAGVFAQRFDARGAPLGPEFQVNTSTYFWQYRPDVAADRAGNFVVAWAFRDYVGGGPVLFDGRIMARRYDANGTAQGPELQVSAETLRLSPLFGPAVSSDDAGNFVVAWDGTPYSAPPGPPPVVGRRLDSSGAPRGGEFPVSSTPPDGGPKDVAIGGDGVGNFVVAWDNAQDGSAEAVVGRRFGGLVPAALAVDTTATGGSDGNGVLEPGEAVDVRPSWRNVNGGALTFDATVTSFGGPAASGVAYLLLDGSTAYGTIANGVTLRCADCYQMEVQSTGARPAVHWDATATERLTPDVLGQTKPWALHVGESFSDVPRTSGFYPFVETLLHAGVTAGCASGLYCPGASTTREEMAAFVLLGRHGAGYAPDPCTPPNLFADVPETSVFCDVIEELSRRGVVAGCGGGNYCPTAAVTREEMPIFVLRTLDPALSPPACGAPRFADVPASNPFCPWIEELARRGIVTGCGGGNYCPVSPVTREQMAVFVSGTFGLALYGP